MRVISRKDGELFNMSNEAASKAVSNHHKRIHFIDELRGFCVFCMVIYHAGYDLLFIFGQSWISTFMEITTYIEPVFAGLFILISGFSSALSRDNCHRGAQLYIIALLFNIITLIFLPDNAIRFGILNLLSICMLLCGVIQKYILKINRYIAITVLLLLFFLTYNVQYGFFGIENIFEIDIPQSIASTYDLYPIGIAAPSFVSSDYFPLLPWMFLFFAGVYLGQFAAENKLPDFMYCPRLKPLSFLGKNALLIYILHQPIIYAIFYVIFLFV